MKLAIEFDALAENSCEWSFVAGHRLQCTKINGDWTSYPHLRCHADWKNNVGPTLVEVYKYMWTAFGIRLICPLSSCNRESDFREHILSVNHWKALRTAGEAICLADGVPVAEISQKAWQQVNFLGGAILINHITWQVFMWKGCPPDNSEFGSEYKYEITRSP